jgi:hypothetical protein
MPNQLTRWALILVLLAFGAYPALATEAKYVPWGYDEYQFFGLTKQQLTANFKDKVEFREDMKRVSLAPQKGACSGYDGATFELSFTDGKVTRVQRIFMGCKETQFGPILESKEAALKYAIAGLSGFKWLSPAEKAKLQSARAELAAMQKSRR